MAIRMGTSEFGGTFYTQGLALAELFNHGRTEGDKCIVETSDASIHNAELLERAELEFGFMASNWIGRAKDGMPPFSNKIKLRMVSPANAGPIFFITLASSPIQTFADFSDKRIAVGSKGSGMEQHVHTLFGVLGISRESFTPLHMSFAEGADALVAGAIDVQFQPPIPNRVMTDLSRRAEVRVVRYLEVEIEKIVSQVPFYRRVVIGNGAFRGIDEDIAQIGVVNVLVTHENVPEPTVYEMARAVIQNVDVLPEKNPLFKGLRNLFEPLRSQGAGALEFAGVLLHPGAARAYREAGWLG